MLHAHHIKSVSFSRDFQFRLLPVQAINAGEWSLDRIARISHWSLVSATQFAVFVETEKIEF